MMSLLNSYTHNPHKRTDFVRLTKVYKLYKDGLFKTCNFEEATKLFKTGKWFDKTDYLPNEEVLKHENPTQPICGKQSETSSEWQEPRHQQHQSDLSYDCSREENTSSRNGIGTQRSEVRKRGRPKSTK